MPRNNFGEIAKTWMFASSSGSGMYETILYVDGKTTTCNCKGWTRRVDLKGQRSCKHTRMVEQGVADQEAESYHAYTSDGASLLRAAAKLLGVEKSKPAGKVAGVHPIQKPKAESGRPKSRFLLKDEDDASEDLVDVERFRKM